MFLQVSVILFTRGAAWSRWVLVWGLPGPGGAGGEPTRTATAAGGMHYTGMHSCTSEGG